MKEGESHDKNADGKVRGNDVYFQDSVVHGGAFPHRRRNVTAFVFDTSGNPDVFFYSRRTAWPVRPKNRREH